MSEYLQLLSFSPEGWGAALLSGAILTLQLALATLPLGLALGLTLALCMDSKRRFPSRAATVFVTVFRGLPELLTIFIIYYGVQLLVKEASEAMGFPGQRLLRRDAGPGAGVRRLLQRGVPDRHPRHRQGPA